MKIIKLMSMLLITSHAIGAQVLYETDNAKSIEQYYGHHATHANKIKNHPANTGYIKATSYQAGYVEDAYIDKLKDVSPFFLIGNDEHSIAWLNKHKADLNKINATGYLIKANNKAEYLKINKMYAGLIIPSNMDGFLKSIHINHIPFLVKDGWIEQ